MKQGIPLSRFSKQCLRVYVADRYAELESEFAFDHNRGWAQVEGKGEEINRAYGEYDAMSRLYDYFKLGDQ